MTQPPDDEPPWQPPGPPPPPPPPDGPPPPYPSYPQYPYPYGSPPQSNPYGGGTTSPYQPIDSGGMPTAVKVVLGVVIGLFGGFVLWFVALIGFAGTGSDDTSLLLAALAPLVVPAPLLLWRAARPWGAGMLIGTAISSIGLSSLCSALLTGV